jgi:hypothetical protein
MTEMTGAPAAVVADMDACERVLIDALGNSTATFRVEE